MTDQVYKLTVALTETGGPEPKAQEGGVTL